MLYCYMFHCQCSLVNDLITVSIFQNSIWIEYILLNNFLVCIKYLCFIHTQCYFTLSNIFYFFK